MKGKSIATCVVALVLCALSACWPIGPSASTPAVLIAASNANQRTKSYVDAAESAVQRATPFTDTTGKQLLGEASTFHAKATAAANDEDQQLAAVTAAVAEKDEQIRALRTDKQTIVAKMQQLKASLPWRIGSTIVGVAVLLIILAVVHVVCVILSVALSPPLSGIAGFVAKIVNPLGWLTLALANVEKNRAVGKAVAAAGGSA